MQVLIIRIFLHNLRTMKMKSLFVVLWWTIFHVTLHMVATDDSNSEYPIIGAIKAAGYPVEVHPVITEDGYILNLQRIKHGKFGSYNRNSPVVFMMHGLLSSAHSFVSIKDGLPFMLADKGYDVWLGNARGNRYSKNHTYLNPDTDASYWDFSWHEIGYYDLPASIKYIVGNTGQERLHYIGHSQGTLVFFVMASEHPEMNKHIKLMVALAPVAFLGHVTNPILRYSSKNVKQIEVLLNSVRLKGLRPSYREASNLGSLLCNNRSFLPICNIILAVNEYMYEDFIKNSQLNASDVIALLLEGFSTRQLYHSAQSINSGDFRRYNFGPAENLKIYGTTEPPSYNLNAITTPVAIYVSPSDVFTKPKDVELLVQSLPNLVYRHDIQISNFNHLDFVLRKNITPLYRDILRVMSKYST